jgi:hypothetical protein
VQRTDVLVSRAAYNDRPSIINEKLGNNVPVFQIAQPIPLPPYNWTTGVGGPAPENVSSPFLAFASRTPRRANR